MESELSELGFPVIAISADGPAELTKSREAKGLGYTLYSDSSLTAARAFGIAFQLDDAMVAQYKKYGVDLEACLDSLQDFSEAYQGAVDQEAPLFRRR